MNDTSNFDLISTIRAEVRQMVREDAELAVYEVKTNREVEAMRSGSRGEQLARTVFGAVFAGSIAWGLIALLGVTAFLVIVAAFAGTALLRDAP